MDLLSAKVNPSEESCCVARKGRPISSILRGSSLGGLASASTMKGDVSQVSLLLALAAIWGPSIFVLHGLLESGWSRFDPLRPLERAAVIGSQAYYRMLVLDI